MNYRSIDNFLSSDERDEVINFASVGRPDSDIRNEHIRKVNAGTKGWSILYDVTKTNVSSTVAKFQGDTTCVAAVPDIFIRLIDRIASELSISKDHVFFQYIFVGSNGKVPSHYDAGVPGYITYKCNICVDGPEEDFIYVDKLKCSLFKNSLYCFEANLYKHWMDASDCNRIHLSYGFMLPYESLGWKESSPRVRMSNRIWKAFINGR